MVVERRRLRVQGVVQGVGFRPFVYRLAVALGLSGSVRNVGDAGVAIEIEGRPGTLDLFEARLKSDCPPLARVDSVQGEEVPVEGSGPFEILPSGGEAGGWGALPPDTSICDACIEDVLGSTRYQGYWATSCTDCGPRFTVIDGLPYDRPMTSMADFPMCASCAGEYTDPLDRRYHAQTIACPRCGPTLTFDGSPGRAVEQAAAALASGRVVAIKGIGGTHIACDARNAETVRTLRRRLGRPGQPFALMATAEGIMDVACVEDEEWRLLRAPQRPIVVLRAQPGVLPEAVAPGLHTVGIMLPYTGLHVLLLQALRRPLVMTSANRPGEPMWITNDDIQARTEGIADHRLLHDRRIVARCDDSVVRRSGGRTTFLRRSRGFVPVGIAASLGSERLIALGPESGLAFGLYAKGTATLSQHIGSVDDVETFAFLKDGIAHLRRLTGLHTLDAVACDLHPQFLTTKLAEEWAARDGLRLVRVQHHEAHLVAMMVEHGLESCIGIILDGYGYGHDGTAWGGEILVADCTAVDRVGGLARVRLPGGDVAAREPLRMAAALLRVGGASWSDLEDGLLARGMTPTGLAALRLGVDEGLSSPWTTSAGRFLDAVAAWTGICRLRTYEGEPAMRLEAAATHGRVHDIKTPIERQDKGWRVDSVSLFRSLVELSAHVPPADVAATAQEALAAGVADVAMAVARERGIETVGFSGGVAYNDAIASSIRRRVESSGLRYVTNEMVPCGDGGVALGQLGYAGQGWVSREAV